MIKGISGPTLAAIAEAREILGDGILVTPAWQCHSPLLIDTLGEKTQLWLKLELWQYAGSFKARAALLAMKTLTPEQRQRGVVAISAGNHAIAVAYAAHRLKIHAKVLMPKTASPIRIAKCQYFGAEVQLTENMQELFERVESIQQSEGRTLIHPFNGEKVALGTGTLGVEFYQQTGELDAIIVGIGGGGLIGGLANAYKQLLPDIKIYGVEPEGAAVMSLSLKAGNPMPWPNLNSIADSLSAPKTEPYPFGLCQQFVDQVIIVSDQEMVMAMRFLFNEMKLAVEPAAAIGIAALFGPLRERLAGQRVGVIISGTNIDEHKYCHLINTP